MGSSKCSGSCRGTVFGEEQLYLIVLKFHPIMKTLTFIIVNIYNIITESLEELVILTIFGISSMINVSIKSA